MSLACIVCHSVESPARSFRSYSVSSSENEGRCSTMIKCLTIKSTVPHWRPNPNSNSFNFGGSSAKVTPQPTMGFNGVAGPPRLVRSRAVSRDLVRDWNFDEAAVLQH